jgi:hypothetical protein
MPTNVKKGGGINFRIYESRFANGFLFLTKWGKQFLSCINSRKVNNFAFTIFTDYQNRISPPSPIPEMLVMQREGRRKQSEASDKDTLSKDPSSPSTGINTKVLRKMCGWMVRAA